MHIIDALSIVEAMKNLKIDVRAQSMYGRRGAVKKGFDVSVGCLPKLWRHQNKQLVSEYCVNDKADCMFKATRSNLIINAPFPALLTLNVNWFSE